MHHQLHQGASVGSGKNKSPILFEITFILQGIKFEWNPAGMAASLKIQMS